MYRQGNGSITLLVVAVAAFILGWTMASSYSLQPRQDAPIQRR